MSKELIVYTCKNCGGDSPEGSSKCNHCGIGLYGMFGGARFHKRWVCPQCDRLHMTSNRTCFCGYKKSSGFFAFIIILFIIILISVIAK